MHPVATFVLLVAAVLLTRGTQFAVSGWLPDLSLAALFLGGLWLRRAAWFAPLMVAIVAADAVAIYGLRVPGDCLSAAYLALVPIYMLVWAAGWAIGRRGAAGPLAMGAAALLAASAAFALSNAAWYFLAPQAAAVPLDAFVAGALRWYPHSALSTTACVLLATLGQRWLLPTSPRPA